VTLFQSETQVVEFGVRKGKLSNSPTTLPHSRAVELDLAGGRVSFYF